MPNYLTSHLGGVKFLLECNYKFEELDFNDLPVFYQNILSYWEDIKHISTSKRTPISKGEIISNNTYVKINGKTVFFKSWYDNGVVKITNLLDGETNFLTLDKFKRTFNLKPYFTTYFGLIHATKEKSGRFFDTPNLQSHIETQKWYEDEKNVCNASLLKVIVDEPILKSTYTKPDPTSRDE